MLGDRRVVAAVAAQDPIVSERRGHEEGVRRRRRPTTRPVDHSDGQMRAQASWRSAGAPGVVRLDDQPSSPHLPAPETGAAAAGGRSGPRAAPGPRSGLVADAARCTSAAPACASSCADDARDRAAHAHPQRQPRQRAAAARRTKPPREAARCQTACASAGASFSVGMSRRECRIAPLLYMMEPWRASPIRPGCAMRRVPSARRCRLRRDHGGDPRRAVTLCRRMEQRQRHALNPLAFMLNALAVLGPWRVLWARLLDPNRAGDAALVRARSSRRCRCSPTSSSPHARALAGDGRTPAAAQLAGDALYVSGAPLAL